MSKQARGSVFDRYGSGRARPLPEPVPDAGEEAREPHSPPVLAVVSNDADAPADAGYKAAFLYKSKARPRLRLHYANGVKVQVLAYAYLLEMVTTSHQWLTLVFTNTVITLKGRNLDRLLDPLQDERVRALVCFRPDVHPQPDADAPCILEIVEQSAREMAEG